MNIVRHIDLYICLTLIMLAGIGLFAFKPFTASAEEAEHTHHGITFEPWTDTTSLPDSGSYYLEDGVTLSYPRTLSGSLTLCLNGHTINFDGLPIWVQSGRTLGIYDCQGNGAVTTPNSHCIRIDSGGTANIYGGTFNGANDAGAPTIIVAGTVTIENASVFGQEPVQIESYGKATINGGTFESTVAGYPTIELLSGSTTKISGGTFVHKKGSNVIQNNQGTLEMSGGTVTGKSTNDRGSAGIVNYGRSATATIKNVTVTTEGTYTGTDDTYTDKGLRNDNGGTMTVENCNINSSNWAVWNTVTLANGTRPTIKIRGGTFKGRYGIYNDNGTFELSGSPAILGSTADIYLSSGQKITVAGALGNAAPYSVLTEDVPTAGNPVMIADSSITSYNDKTKFTSKNSSYVVRKNSDGQLELAVPETYTITYDKGAGSDITGSVPPGTKTEGTDFTLSSETFTRTGYTQTGWSTTDGGAKEYDLGGTYADDVDITLYPYWTDGSGDNTGDGDDDNTGDGDDNTDGDNTDVTTPDVTESDVTEPDITEPTVTEPAETEPTVTEPPAEETTQTAPSYYPSGDALPGGGAPGIAPAGSSVPETVTVKVENVLTGETQRVRAIRDGENVTVDLGKENSGLYANVCTSNENFITAVLIEKGKAKFTIAKDVKFSILIDSESYEDNVTADAGIYSDTDMVEDAVPVIGIIVPIAVSFTMILKKKKSVK